MIYYSPSTNSFYDDNINTSIPQDAIKISDEKHAQLIDGQFSGKKIQPNQNGDPVLVDPSEQELAVAVRGQRDELLRDNVDTMNPMRWNAMSAAQQQQWTDYRQALLDVTQQQGFPTNVVWPVKPE